MILGNSSSIATQINNTPYCCLLRYWKYYNFQKIEGPQSLSRFIRNIGDYRDPNKRLDRIDAAMVWDGNAKTYFFRKDQYWRYNEQRREIDRGYPKPLSVWKLVKNPVHDVMSWKKRKTFFFHENKMYRFDNSKFKLKFKKDKEKQKISYFIKNCRS